jgi:hypothetical protein
MTREVLESVVWALIAMMLLGEAIVAGSPKSLQIR